MMRIGTAALLAAFVGLLPLGAGRAGAERAGGGGGPLRRRPPTSSAQQRRVIRRVPVYPREPVGARRLSALQSRPQCGARLHRDLCAGIPAERHGDHAAHELLLAARLVMKTWIGAAIVTVAVALAAGSPIATAAPRPRNRRIQTSDAQRRDRLQRAALSSAV